MATGYRLTGSGHRGQQFLDSVKGKRDKRDQVFVVTLTDIHDFRQPLSGTEVRGGEEEDGEAGVEQKRRRRESSRRRESRRRRRESRRRLTWWLLCVWWRAGGRGLRRTEGLGGSKRGRRQATTREGKARCLIEQHSCGRCCGCVCALRLPRRLSFRVRLWLLLDATRPLAAD